MSLTAMPWKLLIRQTSALSPGSYRALPLDALLRAVAAVGGIGILITTLFAFLSSGKSAVIYIMKILMSVQMKQRR